MGSTFTKTLMKKVTVVHFSDQANETQEACDCRKSVNGKERERERERNTDFHIGLSEVHQESRIERLVRAACQTCKSKTESDTA